MKAKYKIVGIKTVFDKQNREIEVAQIQTSYTSPPCKQCKRNERQEGSSRCLDCSTAYKKSLFTKNRLKEKINNQIKNK